jgi:hypothetical protein
MDGRLFLGEGNAKRARPQFQRTRFAVPMACLLCACIPLAAQPQAVPAAPAADSRTVQLTVAHQHFGSWCLGYLYVNPDEVWYEVAGPDRYKDHAFRVPRSQLTARQWVVMGQPQNGAEIKFGRSTYHLWLLRNLAGIPMNAAPQPFAMPYQVLIGVITAGGNPAQGAAASRTPSNQPAAPRAPSNQSAPTPPERPAARPAPPTPASAASGAALSAPGSIVYSKAGNLWIGDASGISKRPLTTEGGYRSPSMADDGTVGAIRDEADGIKLVRMSPAGEVISRTQVPSAVGQVVLARLSPDGAMFGLVYSPNPCAYPSGSPL